MESRPAAEFLPYDGDALQLRQKLLEHVQALCAEIGGRDKLNYPKWVF
jgi:hypothetical protein